MLFFSSKDFAAVDDEIEQAIARSKSEAAALGAGEMVPTLPLINANSVPQEDTPSTDEAMARIEIPLITGEDFDLGGIDIAPLTSDGRLRKPDSSGKTFVASPFLLLLAYPALGIAAGLVLGWLNGGIAAAAGLYFVLSLASIVTGALRSLRLVAALLSFQACSMALGTANQALMPVVIGWMLAPVLVEAGVALHHRLNTMRNDG